MYLSRRFRAMCVKEANMSSVLGANIQVFVSFTMLLHKMFLVCLVWRRRTGSYPFNYKERLLLKRRARRRHVAVSSLPFSGFLNHSDDSGNTRSRVLFLSAKLKHCCIAPTSPFCFQLWRTSIEDPFETFDSANPHDLGWVLTRSGQSLLNKEWKRG